MDIWNPWIWSSRLCSISTGVQFSSARYQWYLSHSKPRNEFLHHLLDLRHDHMASSDKCSILVVLLSTVFDGKIEERQKEEH